MVQLRIGSEQVDLDWDAWERRVREGRVPPDALVRFAPITGDAFRPAGSLEMYTSLAASGRVAVERAAARAGPPWCTALLVGVQIRAFFVAQIPARGAWVSEHLTKWTSPELEDGELWRPLTMGFVHTSLSHALMNLVWLTYTAWHLERLLGWRSLVALYVAAVGGGSLLSTFASPAQPSLGASGGIFGLVAAIVVFGLTRPELLPARSRGVFGFALLPYLVLMLFSGALDRGTDNWAHLGGLLVGAALALLADPPGLERRPGWNARWQVGAAVALAAALAVVGGLGPRIEPLATPDAVRAAARERATGEATPPPSPSADGVRFLVPAGWTEASAVTGAAGWTAPRSRRVLAVTEALEAAPVTPETLRARLGDRLVAEGWQADLGAPVATTLAGRPAVRVTGLLRAGPTADDARDVRLTWIAAARGLRTLVVTWEVEPGLADRLAPLEDRLLASIAWPEPADLVEARALAAEAPGRPDVRRELAGALATVGEAEEALALQRAIVAETPTSRKDRLALLRTLAWYPGATPDLDAELDAALAAGLGPQVTAAVADVLDAAGRPAATRGLLEVAWADAPGERTIARARTARGLSNALHPTQGVPLTTWWDLAAGRPRTAAERDALAATPTTIAAVAPLGAATLAAREGLVRALADARDADVVGPLVLLALGHPALDAKAGWDEVRAGVDAAADDAPPAWWPADLPDAAALKARLDAIDVVAAQARVPTVDAGR